jgi:hypothetical protein
MPLKRKAPRLAFAEAYHAAQSFLVHLDMAPSRVDEPADGIVELVSDEYFARLRYDDTPVSQGAILALLKIVENKDLIPILFSASGFTGAAEVFGENLNVALFSIDAEGDAIPRSPAAHQLMPHERFEPPFAVVDENDPNLDRPAGVWLPGQSEDGIADHEWLDCPVCGTTHHPEANFCHRCGAGLARKTRVSPTVTRRGGAMAKAPAPPIEMRRQAGTHRHSETHSMRCRNCGSDDIEVLEE